MTRLKVLLLNPPGDQIYIRDYYCSKVSKAHYLYHPVDLLMLSGTIGSVHEIRVIDGMIEGWTAGGVRASIQGFQPDVVVFLTGIVSFIQDFQFMEALQRDLGFRTLVTGELFLENPEVQLKQYPFLDGAVLDFTDPGILELLERTNPAGGFDAGAPIPNMIYRSGSTIISGGELRGSGEEFEIAIPRHELFPNQNYRYPFVRRFPFATVLTDFGCPFHCFFCAIGRLGHKLRTVNNVLDELDLIKKMGFRDIYFDDQTFGAVRSRTEQILEEMINRRYNLGFICFTRADVVDRDLLRLMKRAGCHTVVFGVESKSDEALCAVNKGMTVHRVREAIGWCKTLNIRTVGTFVVGLPGMTRQEASQIGDFAVELGLDFASFNVPAPRPGTALRTMAINKGWIDRDIQQMDQSGSYAVMGNEHISAEEVLSFRNTASRKFYFRFGYLIHRLMGIRTVYEFKSHLREMANLLQPRRFERRH